METLVGQLSNFNVEKYVGVEDGADKASFLFSVAILAVCCLIVSTKQYILGEMACYIPVLNTGAHLDDYIKNYCWAHGTIPFGENETLPQTKTEWIQADLEKRLTDKYVGIEDGADKASFLFSVIILGVCSVIVSTKQYVTGDISCYIPIVLTGSDLDKYVKNYCWVHGTIPFHANETLPQTKEDWLIADSSRKINYYQWVPFVLGLQGVLFYLPRLIWKAIIYNLSGNDLEGLVVSAKKAANQSGDNRKETIVQVAKCLEDLFLQRRVLGHTKFPVLRQKMSLICCGRRTGVFLVSLYILIKLLYLLNAVCQIILMQNFLKYGTSKLNAAFGWTILQDILSGKQWNDNLLFPRISFCFISDISIVAQKYHHVAQCALPINMLNEKIYIFLWFWTMGVLVLTIGSIPLWLYRMTFFKKRKDFIKRFLKIKCSYTKEKKELISQFVERFLRHDGIFILHIISLNAGDLIATDVVLELWEIYNKFYLKDDFRKRYVSSSSGKSKQTFV